MVDKQKGKKKKKKKEKKHEGSKVWVGYVLKTVSNKKFKVVSYVVIHLVRNSVSVSTLVCVSKLFPFVLLLNPFPLKVWLLFGLKVGQCEFDRRFCCVE